MRKILALPRRYKVVGIIVVFFVLFLIFRGRQKPVEIKFAAVTRNNISSTVSASGVFSGKSVATLHFNSAGKLNDLTVKSGDYVIKGQLIASLDNTNQSVALQEALNNRRNTQAAVDNVHDQVKDHSGDETFSQKATRTTAEVANDNAFDNVRAAEQALRDTQIFAPFNGIVVVPFTFSVGQNVGLSDVIARIVDFSEKDFDANFDESDIGQIQTGQNAIVTLNAYGNTQFKGHVVRITPATQTDSTGAITVTVKIKLDDAKITNIYGLNGNADVITSSKENVLTVPQDALIDDTHVYIKIANGKTEKREVQTGIKSDTQVEVVGGLNESDQVVTNPQAIK